MNVCWVRLYHVFPLECVRGLLSTWRVKPDPNGSTLEDNISARRYRGKLIFCMVKDLCLVSVVSLPLSLWMSGRMNELVWKIIHSLFIIHSFSSFIIHSYISFFCLLALCLLWRCLYVVIGTWTSIPQLDCSTICRQGQETWRAVGSCRVISSASSTSSHSPSCNSQGSTSSLSSSHSSSAGRYQTSFPRRLLATASATSSASTASSSSAPRSSAAALETVASSSSKSGGTSNDSSEDRDRVWASNSLHLTPSFSDQFDELSKVVLQSKDKKCKEGILVLNSIRKSVEDLQLQAQNHTSQIHALESQINSLSERLAASSNASHNSNGQPTPPPLVIPRELKKIPAARCLAVRVISKGSQQTKDGVAAFRSSLELLLTKEEFDTIEEIRPTKFGGFLLQLTEASVRKTLFDKLDGSKEFRGRLRCPAPRLLQTRSQTYRQRFSGGTKCYRQSRKRSTSQFTTRSFGKLFSDNGRPG